MSDFQTDLALPPVTSCLQVVIFCKRESFETYCRLNNNSASSSTIPSFYEYSSKRIIAFVTNEEHVARLYHEVIHQLIDYYTEILKQSLNLERSFWLQEGISSYYEALAKTDKSYKLDDFINWSRLIDSKECMFNINNYQPLSNIVGLTMNEYWNWYHEKTKSGANIAEQGKFSYALSWGFVYFLGHYNNGEYRNVLLKCLKKEFEGDSSKKYLEGLFSEIHKKTLYEIEAEFKKFIINLN
ncbi:MAG: hypothetical protein HY606_05770 [Planctomycetes bacterium]|nr:hypothetical protein [Planctomycetota bacterium]